MSSNFGALFYVSSGDAPFGVNGALRYAGGTLVSSGGGGGPVSSGSIYRMFPTTADRRLFPTQAGRMFPVP